MDTPNVHLLLELVNHTILQHHHASIIADPVLEALHQRLKACLTRDASTSTHLTAMYSPLAKYWIKSVSQLWLMYNCYEEGEDNKKHAMMGLLGFCCEAE